MTTPSAQAALQALTRLDADLSHVAWHKDSIGLLRQFIEGAEKTKQALDMLAGLPPGLTTDEPMAMAKMIFDAVIGEQTAMQREMKSQRSTIEWYAARSAEQKD